MAKGAAVQFFAAGTLAALTLVLGRNGAAALVGPPGTDLRHPAIGETALAAVLGWCLGVTVGLRGGRAARLAYTWGWLMLVFHIAVAFHAGHAWSHRAAFEHVQELSGFGWGIVTNYVFAVVWLFDLVWCWRSLDGYRNRPPWVGWAVHGFTGFVVFNAAVVFNTPLKAAAYGLLLTVPLVVWWRDQAPTPDRAGSGRAR